jgi:hypothetical protein
LRDFSEAIDNADNARFRAPCARKSTALGFRGLRFHDLCGTHKTLCSIKVC